MNAQRLAALGITLFAFEIRYAIADDCPGVADNCQKWASGATELISVAPGSSGGSPSDAHITSADGAGATLLAFPHDSLSGDGATAVFGLNGAEPNDSHAYVRLRDPNGGGSTIDLGPGTWGPAVSADGAYVAYVRLTTMPDPNIDIQLPQVWRFTVGRDPNDLADPNVQTCVSCRLSELVDPLDCIDTDLRVYFCCPSISADGCVISFALVNGTAPPFRIQALSTLFTFDCSVPPSGGNPFYGYTFVSRQYYESDPNSARCPEAAADLGWWSHTPATASSAVSGDGAHFVYRGPYGEFVGFDETSILDPNVTCDVGTPEVNAIIFVNLDLSDPNVPYSELITTSECCQSFGSFDDPNRAPQGYALSDDGRFLVFAWNDPNVDTRLSQCVPEPNFVSDPNVSFDPNSETHVFVTDRAEPINSRDRTVRLTYTSQTERPVHGWPSVSGGGRYVTFTAWDPNGDPNASAERYVGARVYLLDRGSGPPFDPGTYHLALVNRKCGHNCDYETCAARRSWVSDDGKVVTFESTVAGGFPICPVNDAYPDQVYAFDRNLSESCPFDELSLACFADFNCNGVVDQDDLDRMLFSFGTTIGDAAFDCRLDYYCDGIICQDVEMDIVLFTFDSSCEP